MIKRLFLLALMVVLSLGNIALAQDPDNYPPDDKTVVIDSTNLPIVWIDVDGATIDREERISARMKIIHNGKGQLNYGDTVAHPGQHIDYEGYIALRYRGNSSYSVSDKKPYSFRTLSKPLEQGYDKKKVPILGMGKDNNWALLAPYSDKSMIRDLLAFEVARPWMDYTPQGRLCEVYLDGKEISKLNANELALFRRQNVGFVFQFYNLIPNLTAYENVEMAAQLVKDPISCDLLMNEVGLAERKNNFPAQLSGGEQQRVSIARALAKKPKLLLCDEPTGALDYSTGKTILRLLQTKCKEDGMTVVLITHNQAITPMADRVINMRSGKVVSNIVNPAPLPIDMIEW